MLTEWGAHAASPARALAWREPSGLERCVPLIRGPITIGRDPSCSMQLESPYVSRQHARIDVVASGPYLVDLGSRNGSAVNGARVHAAAPLNAGDELAIGDVT